MSSGPAEHHRRSVRLKGFDYAQAGGYFVTVCADKRRPVFGRISEGKLVLNARGQIVRACWQEIPRHFPQTELDAFVVMPNHVHGVIVIHEQTDGRLSGDVGAQHAVPLQSEKASSARAFGELPARSLPAIMRSFKSAVTRRIRERGGRRMRVWQRGYYEHVIRNNDDLNDIRRYIVDNPARWATDSENPDAET
ncbi:MAG TPA: transposase [Planctomycetota bacterium]|nr:transposase [Planctomycetota bacterium]